MKFKRIMTILMIFIYLNVTFSLNIANALNLGMVLDNMTVNNSTTQPSFSKNGGSVSGSFGGFRASTGGGATVKSSQVSISLGFTPPSLNIDTRNSCGISIHGYFGGLHFISSAQISAIIQGITKGAVAFIMHLVIKVLCPACEAVLQLMQNLSRLAAKFAMDACKLGQQLAGKAVDNLAGGHVDLEKEGLQGKCGQGLTAGAHSADWMLSSVDNLCKDLNSSFDKANSSMGIDINKMWDDSAKKADPTNYHKMMNSFESGNLTWKILGEGTSAGLYTSGMTQQLTYDEKVLLMNIIGTIVINKDNGVVQSNKADPAATATPPSTPTPSGP